MKATVLRIARTATLFATILAAGTVSKSVHADPAEGTSDKRSAGSGGDLVVETARLAVRGEAERSPILLLAAAESAGELIRRDIPVVATSVSTGPLPEGVRPLPALEPDALIERTLEYAAGDSEMRAAVETIAARIRSGERGIVYSQGKDMPQLDYGGMTYVILNSDEQNRRLDPGSEYTCSNVVFEAEKKAKVVVVGDGDGDLDLFVYDSNTNGKIGEDTDATSICVVEWTTRYQGPFRVQVKNVGSVWERFYVLANW